MACRVMLDANIILDLTLQRDHYPVSKQVMELAIRRVIDAYITPATVHITSYWLSKSFDKKTVKNILLALLADVKVLDATHEVTLKAIYSSIDDTEDALQYFTALEHNIGHFLTRDRAFIRHALPTLPIMTPEYFMKHIAPTLG